MQLELYFTCYSLLMGGAIFIGGARSNPDILSRIRQGRAIIYPTGTVMQFSVALVIPAEVPNMNIATNMGVLLNVPMPDNATKLFPYLILHRRPNTTTVAPTNNTETTEATPSNTTIAPSNLMTEVFSNDDSSITDTSANSDSSITDASLNSDSLLTPVSSNSAASETDTSSNSNSTITTVSSETASPESDFNRTTSSSKRGHAPKDTPSARHSSAVPTSPDLIKAQNSGSANSADPSSDEEERGNGLLQNNFMGKRGELEENRRIDFSRKSSRREKVDEDKRESLLDDEPEEDLNLLYHDRVYDYIEHYLHGRSSMGVCSIVQVCHVMSVLHENKFARDLIYIFLKPRFLQNPSRVGKQLARLSGNLKHLISKCHASSDSYQLGRSCARLITELWQ